MQIKNIILNFFSLLRLVDKRLVTRLFSVLALGLIFLLADLLTLGLLLPFVSYIVGTENFQIFGFDFNRYLEESLSNPAVYLGAFIIALALISCIFRIWFIRRLTFSGHLFGHAIAKTALNGLLRQPYETIETTDKEKIKAIILVKTDVVVNNVYFAFIRLINGLLIAFCILAFLLFLNFSITSLLLLSTVVVYLVVNFWVRAKVTAGAKYVNDGLSKITSLTTDIFSAIRDMFIFDVVTSAKSSFAHSDKNVRLARASNFFYASIPKFIIEFVAVFIISSFLIGAVMLNIDVLESLPILTAIIFGLQKLHPQVQIVYSSFLNLRLGADVLAEITEVISQLPRNKLETTTRQLDENLKTTFDRPSYFDVIKLENVNFRYLQSKNPIFTNFSAEFHRGKIYGIQAPSGFGKTTLFDIIAGLIKPDKGRILFGNFDTKSLSNQSIRSLISYAPQKTILFDSSLETNIDFGRKYENWLKMEDVLKICRLTDYISSVDSANTQTHSTAGINPSGGERQRIGLARCLFRSAEIYLFDEPTSALDTKNTLRIFSDIRALLKYKFVFIITHDSDLLGLCDEILSLNENRSIP